ncbi:MAG: hypothetical protein LBE71_01960 [Dysgonamonadaceae bacterium]|jgi:hypothetical protein|nr:hypothetical protein [Dysgonamonadaceae bacterium]
MMRIFTCKSCSRIHLEIGNTQIHFNSLHCLQNYLETLDSIDVAYFATVNRAKGLTRVIILPLDTSGIAHIGFTLPEFEDLKAMIRNYLSRKKMITSKFIGLDKFSAVSLN